MPLAQLVYMSSLVTPDAKVASEILEVSVRNNKLNDVTGMMLYVDGNIVQALEGEKVTLAKTFNRISLDARHVGIFVLFEREIQDRDFGSWSMGYKQLTRTDVDRLGAAYHVFEAREQEVTKRVRPSDALQILKSFS
jgi:uncharacterized protein (DUF2252 family)